MNLHPNGGALSTYLHTHLVINNAMMGKRSISQPPKQTTPDGVGWLIEGRPGPGNRPV